MTESTTDLRCDNCGKPHATLPQNQCMVLILVAHLVHDRAELTEEEGLALIPTVSADVLWDDLGEVLDKLAAGAYALDGDR